MEYLKIAQDLEMYGVSYFAITVSANNCYYLLWCSEKCNLITVIQIYISIAQSH